MHFHSASERSVGYLFLMRARVAKYPPRTTFHTASPRTGVKIAVAAAPFSWFRGGPARAMDHLDEVQGLGERQEYESHRPNTASLPPLGSRSDLLQDGSGGSLIASPQLQESFHRRGRVVLVVVVGVGEDCPALLEKAIH